MYQEDVGETTLPTPTLFSRFFVEYGSDFFAGWLGGVAGVTVGHPFDTVKVLQQTRGHLPEYASLTGCCRCIYEDSKLAGFFKGMAFPIASVGLLNSVFFGVYGNVLRSIKEARGGDKWGKACYSDVFLAGSIAGALQGIPACPVELVKVKLQSQICSTGTHLQKSRLYSGPMDCIKHIYKDHGLRGCCRGMNATIAREIPGFGVYMTTYQLMMDKATPEGDFLPSIPVVLMIGGLAGTFSWMVNIPIDQIKSKIQSDDLANPRYRNMWHCAQESYHSSGIKGFWRGSLAVILRAFPNNAVIFAVYTTTLQYLQSS